MKFLENFQIVLPFSSSLTGRESDELLQDIAAEIELGANFDDVLLDLATQDYSRNFKVSSILKAITSELVYLQVEDVLLKYRIISEDEYVLIKNSTNLAAAIRNIIDLRDEGRVYFKWLKDYLLAPFIVVLMGFIVQIPLTTGISSILFGDIIPAITASKGSAPFIYLPFYMTEPIWTYVFLGVFLTLFAGIWIFLVSMYQRNPAWIYRLFALKFYDDFFYYFKIIDIMKKSQPTLTLDAIFEEIGEYIKNDGLKRFFLDMGEKKEDFWFEFERLGAPYTVVKKIRSSEVHDTFFKELNYLVDGKKKGFLWFLKTKRDTRMNSINKWTQKSVLMFAYSFVLFYILMTVASFVSAVVTMI